MSKKTRVLALATLVEEIKNIFHYHGGKYHDALQKAVVTLREYADGIKEGEDEEVRPLR